MAWQERVGQEKAIALESMVLKALSNEAVQIRPWL